ncbi:MAG: hypothetical protein LBV44_05780 [Methylobacillus sp.]|nr:hypothetical protein [Methylobacillus sp.]
MSNDLLIVGLSDSWAQELGFFIAIGSDEADCVSVSCSLPAAITKSLGDIERAALEVRRRYPKSPIVLCIRNDRSAGAPTVDDSHRLEATRVARLVHGVVGWPDFTGFPLRKGGEDSFVDLRRFRSVWGCKAALQRFINEAQDIMKSHLFEQMKAAP